MKTKLALTTLAGLLAASLTHAQPNLVQNGSFESPGSPVLGWSDGWTNDVTPLDTGSTTTDSGIRNADATSYGSFYANLWQYDSLSGAYPYQTTAYSIRSGDAFNVSFAAKYDYEGSGPPQNANLASVNLEMDLYYVDGTGARTVFATDTVNWNNPLSTGVSWGNYTFTADSTTDPNAASHLLGIQFQNVSANPNGNGYSEVEIDNVSVVAVPEPASLALVSLAGLGLLAWRRRARELGN